MDSTRFEWQPAEPLESMPSPSFDADDWTRRRVLGGLGTGAALGLAGCAGRVPGISPESVSATEIGDEHELVWRYPRADTDGADEDGIGYVAAELTDPASLGEPGSELSLTLESTVGGLAASEQYREYEADWVRYRLGPPAGYPPSEYEFRVQPPTWPAIEVSYDRRSGRRELVIELDEIDSGGTITLSAFFLARSGRRPERLHCSFTVQATQPGPLGRTVRANGHGTLPVADSSPSA